MGAIEQMLDTVREGLPNGETELLAIVGSLVNKASEDPESGVLILTNYRLIYRGTKALGRRTEIEWPLANLNSAQASKSFLFEHVEVNAGGSLSRFLVKKGQSLAFVSATNQAIADVANRKENTPRSSDSNLDESLGRLAELFAKGLLSEGEFVAAKRKLLES